MGYSTRRKSISLEQLGVITKRSRAQSHPSPPSTIVEEDESERPAKISKTSHGAASPPVGSTSPRIATPAKPKKVQELSPPPSPAAAGNHKVDVEGINDDIVIATIEQLERTGNRPIFVKELAAVLATFNHSVEKYAKPGPSPNRKVANILKRSANPSALISSRLTAYLNRSWPTISPCPLAKDLSPVHPRRLYFYLTTLPRQPVPEYVEVPKANRIISPSLSSASAADEEDEQYLRKRTALSPSPEVDLSSPELDEDREEAPPTPGAPFSGRSSVARERSDSNANLSHNRRAASPQLEHEERDFKQTASALYEQARQRRNSQQSQQDVNMDQADATAGAERDLEVTMSIEETEESVAKKTNEAAVALFGQSDHLRPTEHHMVWINSPMIKPQVESGLTTEKPHEPMTLDLDTTHTDVSMLSDWDMLKSPEHVDVAELDDMFDAY